MHTFDDRDIHGTTLRAAVPAILTAREALSTRRTSTSAQALITAECAALLRIARAKLRRIVTEPLSGPPRPKLLLILQARLLDCVSTLDMLHTKLTREIVRRRELEAKLSTIQAALDRARAELVGTQEGERRARHLALHDYLTSLPNQRFFRERLDCVLAQAVPSGQQLAVLFIDIDNFKCINDTHGHTVGDEVLRVVGMRLARGLRADDLVGRLGGDEFACLVPNMPSRRRLAQLARKLVNAVDAPIRLPTCTLTVRVSIGAALCPEDGASCEELIRKADTDMFRAKRNAKLTAPSPNVALVMRSSDTARTTGRA